MKKKLRLNFEQLAEEMQLDGNILSTPEDLSLITGGSSLDEIITYFQSMGFNFTVNGSGNLYYQSSDLPDVIVTAYRDSGFNDIPWQLTGSGWLYMNGSYGFNDPNSGSGGGGGYSGGNTSSTGPLPNGDCMFNALAIAIFGDVNRASDIKKYFLQNNLGSPVISNGQVIGYSISDTDMLSLTTHFAYQNSSTVTHIGDLNTTELANWVVGTPKPDGSYFSQTEKMNLIQNAINNGDKVYASINSTSPDGTTAIDHAVILKSYNSTTGEWAYDDPTTGYTNQIYKDSNQELENIYIVRTGSALPPTTLP